MIPLEKAEDLMYKFFPGLRESLDLELVGIRKKYAIKCALIAVDEILQTDPMIDYGQSDSGTEYKSNDNYWNEVKQEINKL